MEFSMLIEEDIRARLELRKGFAGTKATPFRIFQRHALKLLRSEGSFRTHAAAGAKFLVLFLAAGLLPTWSGQLSLPVAHSFWIFLSLMIAGPLVNLVLEWAVKKGAGWPSVLATAERTTGSATVLFILTITLVAMTGQDSFADYQTLQLQHGWLIFQYPWALPILFAFAVVNLFMSFQTVFAGMSDEKAMGWNFDALLPEIRRTLWTLFMVDIFLGGYGAGGALGGGLLIVKCVVLNVISSFGSQLFMRLREDQAESFILWNLTPISIMILALSLLFPGGLS
jgi:hypothetical protein